MKNILKKRKTAGVTLTEVMIAVALLGILVPSMVGLFRNTMRAVVTVDSRNQRQTVAFQGQISLSRDFEEMTEIFFASSTTLIFYLERDRFNGTNGFVFDPNADQDGDRFANKWDADDDGDGLEGLNTGPNGVLTVRDLIGKPREGWRQGSDLQDDDEDNDGNRDVVCRYSWNRERETLERQFNFNGRGWTSPEVLFDHVISSTFTYFGVLDPRGGADLITRDLNGNGILEQTELDTLDGSPGQGVLDDFRETRWITRVNYSFQILVNEGADPHVVEGVVSPRLMIVKEKFQ